MRRRTLYHRNPSVKQALPWLLGLGAVAVGYLVFTKAAGAQSSTTAPGFVPAPTTGAGLSEEEELGPEYDAPGTVLPGGSVVLQ